MDDGSAPGNPWGLHDLEIRAIEGQPAPGLDCGRAAQNSFLYGRAWRDAKMGVTVTHLLYVRGVLAGYVAVMMDSVALGPTEKPKGVTWRIVPAIKIAQLAIDRRFSGRGLGRLLVSLVVGYARGLRSVVGCRLITLDAEPELVGWYELIGFVRNVEAQASRMEHAAASGRDPTVLPVSMRFDLRSVQG
jgi:GNAT superfamily N-acetyltransferase